MKNCTSFLSAFMLTSVLATGAMAYNMTGDVMLDRTSYGIDYETEEEIIDSFSNNTNDNGITLTGGGGYSYFRH